MKTLIKNGRVITPNATISGYVLVEDGIIKEMEKENMQLRPIR